MISAPTIRVPKNSAIPTSPVAFSRSWLLFFALVAFAAAVTALLTETPRGLLVLSSGLLLAFPAALLLPWSQRTFSSLWQDFTWWHVLWLLVLLSGLVIRIRETSQIKEEALDGWALYRMSLIGVVALALAFHLATRRVNWLSALNAGLLKALGAYCLVCFVSAIWSIYPAWTLYKTSEYFVEFAVLAVVLETVSTVRRYKTLFDWTWFLLGLLLTTVWIGAVLTPKEAWQHTEGLLTWQLSGVVPAVSANLVGELGAVLSVVALCRMWFPVTGGGHRFLWSIALVSTLSTMILAQTRSAIGGFALGVVLILFLSKKLKLTAFLVALGTLVPTFSLGPVLWRYILRGQTAEEFQNASSRVSWWEFGWQKFLEQPWGYGAYAGGRFAVMDKLGGISNTHSTYVEIIVGTGVLGLLPVVILVVSTWWVLLRSHSDKHLDAFELALLVEAVGVFAVISVRSFFSVKLIWHPALEFLVVLGYAELLSRRHRGYLYRAPHANRVASKMFPVIDGRLPGM